MAQITWTTEIRVKVLGALGSMEPSLEGVHSQTR